MRSLKLAAALAVLAASFACGDDGGGSNADAGPDVDAGPSPDAAPTSGACGIVLGETYIATANGNPLGLEGHSVVFSAPDGSVLSTATTDVKGAASFGSCGPDTQITLVIIWFDPASGNPSQRAADMYTYAGVQPGDTVYLGGALGDAGIPPSPLYANSNVSLSQDLDAFPEIGGWDLTIGCDGDGDEGPPPSLATIFGIEPDCLGTDANIDYLARMYDYSGNVVGYSTSKGVPVVTGIDGLPGDTVVTMPAWTPGDLTYGIVVHNFPDFFIGGGAYAEQSVDTVSFAGDTWNFGSGSLSESFVFNGVPEDFGDVYLTSVMSFFEAQGGDAFSQIIDLLSTFPRTHTIDLANESLPRVSSIVATTGPNGRPALTWLADGSLSGASTAVVQADISRNAPGFSSWTVITPNANAGTVEMPDLPEALADLFPSPQNIVYPYVGGFADLGVFTYEGLITTEGFYPFGLFAPDIQLPLDAPPAGLTARLRRTVWWSLGGE